MWRNSTTVAEMSASYFAPKNETGFGTSAFHVIFYDAAAPLAAERYAQTMAEITSYRQIDSSNR